jgi:signal recognition particle GTPase
VLPDKKKPELTFGQAWIRYEAWLETARKTTRHEKARYKKYLKKRFAKSFLSEINSDQLEKLKATLIEQRLAPATVKHILILVRQVYNKKWLLAVSSG